MGADHGEGPEGSERDRRRRIGRNETNMTFNPLADDVLRATTIDEFVGQEALKDRLKVFLASALKEKRPPGHVLLIADAGFGKTSLAGIIAHTLGVPFELRTMPVETAELATLLVIHEFQGVLLLDELHRASTKQQEELMPLIEFGYLQYRGHKFPAEWLTVVAATTHPKKIIPTLRERFDWEPTIDPYTKDELAEILQRMSRKLNVDLDDSTVGILAGAMSGSPRHARKFALAARDLYVVGGQAPPADLILDHLRVDREGLTVDHWRYLAALHKLGAKAGLRPLASYLNESEEVLEGMERLLIDLELIEYASDGRHLTTKGLSYLRKNRKAVASVP